MQDHDELKQRLDRIEEKLDALIDALAEAGHEAVDDAQPRLTLDGEICGGERDQTMSLG